MKLFREMDLPWAWSNNLKKAETMFQEMGMDYWLGKARKVLETVKEEGENA